MGSRSVDWDAIAGDYHRHRAIAPSGLEAWRAALAPFAPAAGGAPWLDLGAGTGLFASALVRWFGARVLAVEPSAGMRAEGRRSARDPRIAWLGGEATRLPLRAGVCHAAWLSTVIHHVPDLEAAARELARVLRPGGAVLVRNAFPGRLERITLFRWFPGAARVADSFPSVERLREAFAPAGFAFHSLDAVPQTSAASLREFAERVRGRADSTLRRTDDAEFAAGLARLERAAAAEREPTPVVDWLDLLVLVRS